MVKTIYPLFFLSFIFLTSYAQNQISNNSFEEWHKVSTTNFSTGEDPDDWGSTNILSDINFFGMTPYPVLISKSTEAHTGNYAIKLTNNLWANPVFNAANKVQAGFVGLNASFDLLKFNPKKPRESSPSGIPFEVRPDSLVGYIKGTLSSDSTIYVGAVLFKYENGKQRTVGEAYYFVDKSYSEYTRFSIPFSYLNCNTPDSIDIILSTGAINSDAHPTPITNVLYVDDISLIYNTQVPETKTIQLAAQEDTPLPIAYTNFNFGLSCIAAESVQHGAISSAGAYSSFYYPNKNFTGKDTIITKLCQGNVCNTGIVYVDVLPVNDPPISEAQKTEYLLMDSPKDICVSANDFDDDVLFYSQLSSTQNGSIIFSNNACGSYTPPLHVGNITDTVLVLVCDDEFACDTTQFIFVISSSNNAPSLSDTTFVSIEEDGAGNLCLNAIENEQDIITLSLLSATHTGLASTFTDSDCIHYAPLANYHGTEYITIQLCDNYNACDTTVLAIEVSPINDAPSINKTVIVLNTPRDQAIQVCNYGVDIDGDTLAVHATTPTLAHGVLTEVSDSCLLFTPTLNFVGTETFTIQVCDNEFCQNADVTIQVTSGNAIGEMTTHGIKVYPTVAVDVLTIETATEGYSFYCYDMTGKLVTTSLLLNGKTKYPVHSLTNGIYYIQIKDKTGLLYTTKFIKE